ncbi:armadillo repeat-containing protein 2 isoform X1 [Phthorimaea operculella]|nr:armadillo repeat-containing protein 2 isoform X1 [Phthorimaea operculella]
MSGASAASGASGGALRPLRTRRPFTPREPQRTLFTERARKKETRPPSAFDLKYLSLAETGEDLLGASADGPINGVGGVLITEPQKELGKKRPVLKSKSVQDRSSDGWGGFPKLPHLNGRSKPLHRRNTGGATSTESKHEQDLRELAEAISITRPLGSHGDDGLQTCKSLSPPEPHTKRKIFGGSKSVSCDASSGHFVDIGVKHLAVQLPNTSGHDYDNMSILELAEALSHKPRDVDNTVYLMEALQVALQRNQPTASLREMVLRSLYMHIDSQDERVLVAIARAMLTLRVTGNHLAAACKLVFKIARNDKNDHFFRNTDLLELLVEGCGRADPLSEGECCVYGAGALRFLALDPKLCALAHKAGALHLAALHLKILNNAKAENPRAVSEQSTHALYQLTGALRNLAGASQRDTRAFVQSGALGELVSALMHHTDRDVLTNVARCLSVLSAEDSCCAWLCASSDCAHALLRALAACAARAPLAVRLAYTLGNMAAADEQARINIYNEEGGVDVLLTILESYSKRNEIELKDPEDPDLHLVGSDLCGSDGSNEDVLIKTVRVVANLCLAERAGRGLAAVYAERTIRALLGCLELAERSTENTVLQLSEEQRNSWAERRDELATAALATLNNITFYREPPDPDPLDNTLDLLCRVTCRWLKGSGMASCEAVRALGNLSRCTSAAQLIVVEGVLDNLVPFLHHEDASVRCSAAGVLVNVCGAGVDSSFAAELASRALSSAAAAGDSSAAALLTRALWNAHAHKPLTPQHAHQAATALTMFIEVDSSFAEELASRALSSAAAAGDSSAAALLTRALWNAHAHKPLTPQHAHQAATALTMFIAELPPARCLQPLLQGTRLLLRC